MAAPRGRGRPPKINEQAEQLSIALAFVSAAYVKDETLECAPYVRLGNNMAVVYSRQMSAGHPIAEEIELCPHLDKLKSALARTGKSLTITKTPKGSLSVSGDKENIKALIPCWAEPIPYLAPDDNVAIVDERLRNAFKACAVLSSESAERVIEASILLEANVCSATNGFALLQFWHGIDLPPHIVIPKVFAAAVCKVDKKIEGFGFSWDYNLEKPGSITIWFEGGAWLRCQCYSDRWQDISHITDAPNFPADIPAGFFKACEGIASLGYESVYFGDNKLMSNYTIEAGSYYEVSGIQPGKRLATDYILKLQPYITKLDLTTHEKIVYFIGGEESGPMRGAIMGMTGGVEPATVPDQKEANALAEAGYEAEIEMPNPNVGWQ